MAARDGQLRTTVRMMNTNSDTAGPFYVADTGSVILKLKWISSSRVLAVFDTYAAIINVSDGTESARYDYGGATPQKRVHRRAQHGAAAGGARRRYPGHAG